MGSRTRPILIVDDDADFRAMVATVLESAGYATLEAGSQRATMDAVTHEAPTLALVDVNLDGVTGYAVLRDLRERFGERLPVILISGARVEPFDVSGGFVVGADDYIVKPVDPGELVARVNRLVARSSAARPASGSAPRRPELTPREHEVLDLLVDGQDQDAIARRLVISPNTVATHIQRILTKLGVHSRAQAVALAAREQLFARDFAG
jgi:two-component system, NarL family, nitrate/nitrite response regulator NarL